MHFFSEVIVRLAKVAGIDLRTQRSTARQRRLRAEHLEQRALLAAGDPDLSFGMGGQVSTEFDNTSTWGKTALASALQTDGRIVVAGEGALARHLPDGTLDASFGVAGRVAFPYYARSIAIQTDGSIVAVGGTDEFYFEDFVVARYLSNGTLDTSFDADGILLTDFGGTETAYGVAIQANGRIVVVGGSNDSIVIARYNTDGALDATFDGDGKFIRRFNTNRSDTAYSVAIDANGKIVVAGTSWVSYTFNSSNRDFFVMRLNTGGFLDRTFDTDGYLNTNFSPGPVSSDEARDVAIQSDGKIVVTGYARINFNDHLAVARYNPDGSLDETFNNSFGGRKAIPIPGFSNRPTAGESVSLLSDGRILTMANGSLYQFTSDGSLDTTFDGDGVLKFGGLVKTSFIQPDGKIIAAGSTGIQFLVMRFATDGSRDVTFSLDGSVETGFGPSIDEAKGSVLQPNGKLIVVGQSLRAFGIARYNANGSPDLRFSQDGRTTIDFGPTTAESGAADVAVQPDGKIIVVGFVRFKGSTSWSSQFAVVRLNVDGSLDTTFSGDGIAITDVGDFGSANAIALQTDGRIVVGGSGFGQYFTLARYNTDGSPDRTFSGDGIAKIAGVNNASSISEVRILPDGKLLAVGNFFTYNSSKYGSALMLARFNDNGTIDTSFGTNGRVIDSTGQQRTGNDVAILPDGSFLVAGDTTFYKNNSASSDTAISRFNSDGARLSTRVFTFDWPIRFDPFETFKSRSAASSILVQPNGKILLAGSYDGYLQIVRLNSDETLDTSFSGDGKSVTQLGEDDSTLADILQQPDGRLIVVGSRKSKYPARANSDFAVARLLEVNEPAASTLVTVNSAGNVQISDLWSRDDKLTIQRTGESVLITDQTEDSHAKFQIVGVAGAIGDGTKQISIPLSTIQATGKPLVVSGLVGDDTLTIIGDEEVNGLSFVGGPGTDTLSQETSNLSAVWNLNAAGTGSVTQAGRFPRHFSNVEYFVGGQAADTFRLNGATSSLQLRLNGGGGQDTIQLTADADITLLNRSFPSGQSTLSVSGTMTQQTNLKGFESAILIGGAGNNRIDASRFIGPATLLGRQGNDQLIGTQSNDILSGEDGDDVLYGDYGDDTLRGGNGNDFLSGESGNDSLFGETGNDILIGGLGVDLLNGGAGEDLLIGSYSNLLQRFTEASIRDAIVAAWVSADAYTNRVVLLRDTGIAGAMKLTPGTNVLDDSAVDTLIGGSGLDWFFASNAVAGNEIGLATGGLRLLESGEVVTVLS